MSWHRPNAPSGPITSPFGKRGPIPGAPNASTYHLGVDLRAGTLGVTSDIYAATAGTVRRIYKTPLGAWVLELDHGGGVRTRYAHMQQAGIAVKVGAKVTGGQRVAAASNSGAPTIHLHFEVLLDGVQVDPVPYLRARGVDLTVTTTSKPGAGTGSISPPALPTPPTLTPPGKDQLAMATLAEVTQALASALFNATGSDGRNIFDSVIQTRAELRDRAHEGATNALAADPTLALLKTRTRDIDLGKGPVEAVQVLAETRAYAEYTNAHQVAINAALVEVVRQLSSGVSGSPVAIDYDRIAQITHDAVAKGIDVNVTVTGA